MRPRWTSFLPIGFLVLTMAFLGAGCASSSGVTADSSDFPESGSPSTEAMNSPGSGSQGNLVGKQCLRFGTSDNFNDHRIVGFQKLLQLQILRIKSSPMTQESTQELSLLEGIRRRTAYPLLTSTLSPKKVTEILKAESQSFVEFLEARQQTDSQAQVLFKEMKEVFIPLLESQAHWNCLEEQTDFELE
jgi:hypothetical protein